jgi:S1-C subfamily serine protease
MSAPVRIRRRARWVTPAVTLLWLAAVPATASAEPVPVDSSTVRVFAIGTVSTEQVEVAGAPQVAAKLSGGHGTGFFVDNGLVMTANHVIDGARHVVVRLPGTAGLHPARVLYADDKQDVAILALDTTEGLPPALALGKAQPHVRSNVFAIGYPLDATRTQPQSARGIIAGFLDDGTIQLDMALNPGNSGGPVVDDRDVVIAMAIARGKVDEGVQGIGYAVPAPRLQAAVRVARRRLTREPGAPVDSRDSANVVDQLIQHGALDALRGSTGSAVDLERALDALGAKIGDADLLVCVAGALWNAALWLDGMRSGQPREVAHEAPTVVAARLRSAVHRLIHRAVELDAEVAARSSFIGLVQSSEPPARTAPAPGYTGAPAAVYTGAPAAVYTLPHIDTAQPVEGPSTSDGEGDLHLAISAAPIIRFNASDRSIGYGYGAGIRMEIGRRTQRVVPLLGVSFGNVSLASYTYTLVSPELGFLIHLGRLGISGAYTPCWYQSSIDMTKAMGSVSAFTSGGRVALDYRFGFVSVGAGVRGLDGPTLWIEPLYVALGF